MGEEERNLARKAWATFMGDVKVSDLGKTLRLFSCPSGNFPQLSSPRKCLVQRLRTNTAGYVPMKVNTNPFSPIKTALLR